jgi:hypothetical protein
VCVYSIKDPLRTGGRPPMVAVNLSSSSFFHSYMIIQLVFFFFFRGYVFLGFVCVVPLNKRKCLLMDDVMTARE